MRQRHICHHRHDNYIYYYSFARSCVSTVECDAYLLLHFDWNFANSVVYGWAEGAHGASRWQWTFHRCIDPQWLRWWAHRMPMTMPIAHFRIGAQWHFHDWTRRSLLSEFRLKWRTKDAFVYRPRRFFLRHFLNSSSVDCQTTPPAGLESSTICFWQTSIVSINIIDVKSVEISF